MIEVTLSNGSTKSIDAQAMELDGESSGPPVLILFKDEVTVAAMFADWSHAVRLTPQSV